MSVDFPRAWEITKAVSPEYHHNKCSYNTHRMLCDCDVLFKHSECLDESVLYGVAGKVTRLTRTEQQDGKTA